MASRNNICWICENKFHACSSCGLDEWEYKFCSEKCLKVYQEQKLPDILEKYMLSRQQLFEILVATEELYLL